MCAKVATHPRLPKVRCVREKRYLGGVAPVDIDINQNRSYTSPTLTKSRETIKVYENSMSTLSTTRRRRPVCDVVQEVLPVNTQTVDEDNYTVLMGGAKRSRLNNKQEVVPS